mgnify:CR=1 FL=1
MGDSLLYKLRSGKPPKIFFFLKGYLLFFQVMSKALFGTGRNTFG